MRLRSWNSKANKNIDWLNKQIGMDATAFLVFYTIKTVPFFYYIISALSLMTEESIQSSSLRVHAIPL